MRALTDDEKAEVINRLFRFSYFQKAEWKDVRDLLMTDSAIRQVVSQYRAFHELPPGEEIDEQMFEHISRPRCGMPDFARAEAAGCKWPMLEVTLAHRLSALNPLSAEIEHQCVVRACAAWNAVCGINLQVIDDMGSANIYSQVGSTGAGVLAYSYLPCGASKNTRLQQVYNRSVNWSTNLLTQVLIHEIGHAIGLDHGPPGALMQPTADGRILSPQSWDIAQVQSRYGKPKPKPDPEPQPQPPTPVPPTGGQTIGRIVLDRNLRKGDTLLIQTGALPSDDDSWGMG